LLYVILLQMP